MEFTNFVQNNNITSYEVLKSTLEVAPYNLKFKEDVDVPGLILVHPQDSSDVSSSLVRACNGLIFEKDTFKVLCYSFDKMNDSTEPVDEVDYNNCFLQDALEGTLLRVYYYNNKWILSTKKSISAGKSRWVSQKNFQQLFIESHGLRVIHALTENESIVKNYGFSFLMVHPENNILYKPSKPLLYHLTTRDMATPGYPEVEYEIKTDNEELNPLKVPKISFSQYLEGTNIKNIYSEYINHETLTTEGFVFIDNNNHRHKIIKNKIKHLRALWGNNNNRLFRYLELRRDISLLDEYLTYFKDDKYNFLKYENEVQKIASTVLDVYINKFVNKTNTNVPFYFKKLIYNLHGDFLKSREQTDYTKVLTQVNTLDVKEICHILNNMNKDENKEIVEAK